MLILQHLVINFIITSFIVVSSNSVKDVSHSRFLFKIFHSKAKDLIPTQSPSEYPNTSSLVKTSNSFSNECSYEFPYEKESPNFEDENLLMNISNFVKSRAEKNTFIDHPGEFGYAPGVVVTVQTTEGLFEDAYGYGDADFQTPMPLNAKIQIGSNTKMFIGTLSMQAEEKGLLHRSDKIADHIPDVAVNIVKGEELTIRECMTHNTGIVDYGDIIIASGIESRYGMVKDYKPEELLDSVKSMPAEFEHGTCENFQYSNSGYVLVGLILEMVHNSTIEDILNEGIIKPLQLNDTTFFRGSPNASFLDSHGYYWTNSPSEKNLLDVTRWNLNQGWAAGAIISTGRDMVTFARALGRGELFSGGVETFAKMTDYFRNSQMALYGFSGYGMGIAEPFNKFLYAHGGQTLGFLSTFVFSVKNDFQVFIAQNEATSYKINLKAYDFGVFA